MFIYSVAFIFLGICLAAIYFYTNELEKRRKAIVSLIKERNAITALSKAIILTLDPFGIIKGCNKAAEVISGHKAVEIIGFSFSNFIDLNDDIINLRNFSKKYSKEFKDFSDILFFAKDQPIEQDVIWTIKNSGPLYFHASIAPLYDDVGIFTGYVIEANEITAKVKQDEKLLEARILAENASRAQGRFLAGMSHDLRTPLTAIIGYTDILEANREGNLSDKQLDYLKRIEENGQHLLDMIKDILDLEKFEARKETVEFSEVSVESMVEQIFHGFQEESDKKGVKLLLVGGERVVPLRTDEKKIYRILLNLISNGVKFTDKGSVTVVITKNPESGKPIRIDVVDTGIGIDPKNNDQIFQPFFQVDRNSKRKDKGTGLGLSICHAYCLLLGYRLNFESKLGEGSTFTLHLNGG